MVSWNPACTAYNRWSDVLKKYWSNCVTSLIKPFLRFPLLLGEGQRLYFTWPVRRLWWFLPSCTASADLLHTVFSNPPLTLSPHAACSATLALIQFPSDPSYPTRSLCLCYFLCPEGSCPPLLSLTELTNLYLTYCSSHKIFWEASPCFIVEIPSICS